jgi:chaperonin GroES
MAASGLQGFGPAAGPLQPVFELIHPFPSRGLHQMTATATKPARKKSTLIPLGDRVVVEREESEQKTSGGILLPDSAKDKPARGTVVSVGEGKCDDKGVRHPLQVKPGDRVVFTSYAGEAFKIGDDELLLMREDDILAILG